MKVSIKKFPYSMEIKSKGVEFDVYDKDKHLGDLVIGKAKIEWCEGKTHVGKGIKKSWEELIAFFNKA